MDESYAEVNSTNVMTAIPTDAPMRPRSPDSTWLSPLSVSNRSTIAKDQLPHPSVLSTDVESGVPTDLGSQRVASILTVDNHTASSIFTPYVSEDTTAIATLSATCQKTNDTVGLEGRDIRIEQSCYSQADTIQSTEQSSKSMQSIASTEFNPTDAQTVLSECVHQDYVSTERMVVTQLREAITRSIPPKISYLRGLLEEISAEKLSACLDDILCHKIKTELDQTSEIQNVLSMSNTEVFEFFEVETNKAAKDLERSQKIHASQLSTQRDQFEQQIRKFKG